MKTVPPLTMSLSPLRDTCISLPLCTAPRLGQRSPGGLLRAWLAESLKKRRKKKKKSFLGLWLPDGTQCQVERRGNSLSVLCCCLASARLCFSSVCKSWSSALCSTAVGLQQRAATRVHKELLACFRVWSFFKPFFRCYLCILCLIFQYWGSKRQRIREKSRRQGFLLKLMKYMSADMSRAWHN